MFDSSKKKRWDYLRQRERVGALTEAERGGLEALIRELEDAELERLRPALARMDEEKARFKAEEKEAQEHLQRLARLMAIESADWQAARQKINELSREYETLKAEYARLTGKELVTKD